MSGFPASERFMRPVDVVRRNQRQIQARKLLMGMANLLLISGLVIGALWIYQRSQNDARFAIRTIEVTGAAHTPRHALEQLISSYRGTNLFKIDLAALQAGFRSLDWVERIEIEKALPDTLRIRVLERKPAALAISEGRVRYVDGKGVLFADLTPETGNSELPLIVEAPGGEEVRRCVEFLRRIQLRDPELYSRISEVAPMPLRGFRMFTRDLEAIVYTDDESVSKWRTLYAIAAAERYGKGAMVYADLRFEDRIVVGPAHQPDPMVNQPVRSVSQIAD